MKKIYVFGNGNLSWEKFQEFYLNPLQKINISECGFIIGDFVGADVLMMEYLKDKTENVTILHIGEKPRYIANKFKTNVGKWKIIGGFQSDVERDDYAVSWYTHFLAMDFNSDEKRKSGTLRNIEKCFALNRLYIS